MSTVKGKEEFNRIKEKARGSNNHSLIQGNIIGLFFLRYRNDFRVLPELNILMEGNKYIPDISIFKERNFLHGKDQILVDATPLGIIEILSPTQVLEDLTANLDTYFKAGVKSYWIILPDLKTIYVYNSVADYEIFAKDDTLEDPVLDVRFSLEDIFR
jgi:Uma2 family endonuclease